MGGAADGIDRATLAGAAFVEAAIASRRAVRAFLPDPVPRALVERILTVAARAPSGTNMQSWRVHVIGGETRERLTRVLLAAHDDPARERESGYRYYPPKFFEPYLSRRRKVGWDLYGLLGIEKGDHARMQAQHAKNLTFFGAPVAMICTIDRRLEIGSWLDYGMFLQNIMIAARGHGLDTCPQAAFAPFGEVIKAELSLPEEEVVVCGMALGHADPDAPENRLETTRAALAEFVSFVDVEEASERAE